MIPTSTYTYRAARSDGALELGSIESTSRESAVRLIIEKGLYPIAVTLDHPIVERRGKLASDDLALGLNLLAELIQAGLAMPRVLAAFSELAPPAWRRALPAIQEDVRQGKGLGAALGQSALHVPPAIVAMIQAGEAGSGFSDSVRRAAVLAEASAATRKSIRSALTYPVILASAGLVSLSLLIGLVLPRLAAVLGESGQPVPPLTSLVLSSADLARTSAIPALVLAALGLAAWRSWLTTEAGQQSWHALLLRLPFIGRVRRSAAVARAAATSAAMLESGVPVSSALLHSARAAADSELGARLVLARESVLEGNSVSGAIADAHAMTPTAVRLVRAGEETGRLAAMFAQVARIEEGAAERTVKNAVRLIEPALVITFGAIVALVAAALLQAVYGVRVS